MTVVTALIFSSPFTVERRTSLRLPGPEATVSLLSTTFDLAAFNQMFRMPSLQRWTTAPPVLLEMRAATFVDRGADDVTLNDIVMSDAEATSILSDLTRALPQLSGGKFPAFASVGRQTSAAGSTFHLLNSGVITVIRATGMERVSGVIGLAQILRFPDGRISGGMIILDRDWNPSNSPFVFSVRAHELGHNLGMSHVTLRSSVMHPTADIHDILPFDRDAARVAYQRPPGNRAPDVDPEGSPSNTLGGLATCGTEYPLTCAFTILRCPPLASTAALTAAPAPAQSTGGDVCALTTTDRVVAIGDVHGGFDQFTAILKEAGIVDKNRKWAGGKTIFVQTGDLVDRGPDSRKALDLLRQLEKDAPKTGGRVIALLGNHEVMRVIGDTRYVSPGEYAAFRDAKSEDLRKNYYESISADRAAKARAAGEKFDEPAFRKSWYEAAPLDRSNWRSRSARRAITASGCGPRHDGDHQRRRLHARRHQPGDGEARLRGDQSAGPRRVRQGRTRHAGGSDGR